MVIKKCKALLINCKIIFANNCIGGTRNSLKVFCSMLDLPSPVSQLVPELLNLSMQMSHNLAKACVKPEKIVNDMMYQVSALLTLLSVEMALDRSVCFLCCFCN